MNQSASFLTLITLAGGALLAATAAHGAKRLGPPTAMMMGNYQQVAVVVAEESPEAGKVLFKRKKMLFGEMPKRVVARLDAETLEDLVWGQRYVFAYTDIRRNLLDRESPERDPEGPKVIELPVIGAALLENTPEIRSLFAAAQGKEPDLGRDYLNALIAQLARPDARTRRFVIAELYMRPQLFEHLKKGDLTPIRSALASPATGSEARSFLLESSKRFPPPLQGPWRAEAARDIVEAADTDLELGSTQPLLVKNALLVLEKAGGEADVAPAARHFDSNNPGVAKAALAALVALDLEAAARRAREVLGRGDLHHTTRQAMEQFLEQYRGGNTGG